MWDSGPQRLTMCNGPPPTRVHNRSWRGVRWVGPQHKCVWPSVGMIPSPSLRVMPFPCEEWWDDVHPLFLSCFSQNDQEAQKVFHYSGVPESNIFDFYEGWKVTTWSDDCARPDLDCACRNPFQILFPKTGSELPALISSRRKRLLHDRTHDYRTVGRTSLPNPFACCMQNTWGPFRWECELLRPALITPWSIFSVEHVL